jgi:hypothetical protein
MKICKRCKKELMETEFYKHKAMGDGLLSFCKTCTRERVAKRLSVLMQNKEFRNSERKRTRERNQRLGYSAKYKAIRTAEQQRKLSEAKKRWIKNNPEKRKAHLIVGNALRDGRLKKGLCFICGTNKNIEAHHPDYSKPLEILWICRKHHGQIHWIEE